MHLHDYPQWLNLSPVTANSQTYVSAETQLNPPTQQHVLEVCKVETRIPQKLAAAAGAGSTGADVDLKTQVQITRTLQTAMLPLENPDMVSLREVEAQVIAMEATETGAGFSQSEAVKIADYMAGDKGFLVAAQSLFLAVDTVTATFVEVIGARILARWVKVSLEQLIEMTLQ